jgi:hypothetical protein
MMFPPDSGHIGSAAWRKYVQATVEARGMVDSVVKTLRQLGVPAKRILFERLAF